MTIGIARRLCQRHDEGMPLRHAAQFDLRQRPKIADLINERRPRALGDPAGGIALEAIRRGSDDRLGHAVFEQSPTIMSQLCDEREHIQDAPGAVAAIGRCFQPDVADAVDVFLGELHGNAWLFDAQMRKRRRHDRDAMPQVDPFAGEVIGAIFHAVPGRSRVMIDKEDIHRSVSVSFRDTESPCRADNSSTIFRRSSGDSLHCTARNLPEGVFSM